MYRFKAIRRGWCLGNETFRAELLKQAQRQIGLNHFTELRRETAQEKARRLLQEELDRLGWSEAELERSAKGDACKARIARRLREETSVTLKWIADRLRMGTRGHLTHLLYWQNRQKPKPGRRRK